MWKAIVHLLEWLDHVRIGLEGLFFFITAVFIVVGWLPSPRLIRRVLFHGEVLAFLRAFRELMECLETMARIAPTQLLSLRGIRRAVRVWVEYEIFHHHPQHESPGFAPWRIKWWRTLSQRRRLSKRGRSERIRALRELAEGGSPQIDVETCFDLQDDQFRHIRSKVERYFTEVHEDPAPLADRFISTLRVRTGYVAPLHLLAGLLAHFRQDWVPVINDFGRILARHDDPLRDTPIRRLQAFIFDCWLIWGPSIPVCRCAQWTRGNVEALQLGYGDENNSLPLVSTDARLLDQFDELISRIKREGTKPPYPLAIQVVVTGRLRSGTSVPEETTPLALHGIRDGMVLEYLSMTTFSGSREAMHRIYYSAYLWVIFVVLDSGGQPLFPPRGPTDLGDMWRGLLPFFEHGNIADGVTYDFLKRQLARKAMAALERLVTESSGWRFAYACAFDHPGCTPPAADSRRFPEPAPSVSLRAICEELLATEFTKLAGTNRVTTAGTLGPEFSACYLPDVIDAFYEAARHSHHGR